MILDQNKIIDDSKVFNRKDLIEDLSKKLDTLHLVENTSKTRNEMKNFLIEYFEFTCKERYEYHVICDESNNSLKDVEESWMRVHIFYKKKYFEELRIVKNVLSTNN